MKIFRIIGLGVVFVLLSVCLASAQDADAEETEPEMKEAKIELTFVKDDSLNVCNILVTSDGNPAPEVSVKLYVKRLFGLLPIGDDVTTDEDGAGVVEFPKDLPGDANKELEVVAKIEDDENFGTVETTAKVNWGLVKQPALDLHERSLAGSRANAPIYFIVVSNLIIFGIWGTLIYVVLQVFKIKKLGRASKKV